MDPQGKVWFGVYNNGSYTVNTANSLNDGQWHHVVGTMDTTGPTLYVDGKKIGHNGGTSSAQPYNGYWRIGGDSAWNGNPYFNGTIDDVAIYPTSLPLTKVQQHYTASGRTLNVPTRPSDTYGGAIWDSTPDLYWRLGEASGPTAAGLVAERVPRRLQRRHRLRHPWRGGRYAQHRSDLRRVDGPVASAATGQQPDGLLRGAVVQDHDELRRQADRVRQRPVGQQRGLRPARLHVRRRPPAVRRLDRVHECHRHAPGLQRRQLAPHGGHPGARRHEALRRRTADRHQRADAGPGLRRVLACGW